MRITRPTQVVVALVLVLSACSAPETETSTPSTLPAAATSTVATTLEPTSTTAAQPAVTLEPHFDARASGDVFAMVEQWEGGMAAGWSSPLIEPAVLPDDVEAVAPDGRGGVVFVAADEVWWMPEPTAEAQLIEQPGIRVHLIGLRHVDGEPVVLALIGHKLIGYDRGVGHLALVPDQLSGDVLDIDVGRSRAVVIVAGPAGRSVEMVELATGDVTQLAAPIAADDPASPLKVAISQDRIVVLFSQSPGLVLNANGDRVGSVALGIEDMAVHSVDLVGDELLVAFGEAATTTSIATGDRSVVATLEGWVLGATFASAPDTPPPDLAAAERFRVNTKMVEADAADPYLNVRLGPSVDHDLLAKLPATYTGIGRTGPEETTEDGAVWYQVELLHPVRVTPSEPLEGRRPLGWVNSAFLEPLPEGLPVTLDEIPGCADVDTTITQPAGAYPPDYVYALESAYLSDRCLRIVLTFGSGEVPGYLESASEEIRPADYLPAVDEWMSGSPGSFVSLGGINDVWWEASETADGVYVVRDGDQLHLWALQSINRSTIWGMNERGVVVIDLHLEGDREPAPAIENVVLTRDVTAWSEAVLVTGIARPWEGMLGVTIEDDAGNDVDAVFSGSLLFGTKRAAWYAIDLPDWWPAWRPFTVQAEGLAPGDYTMVLDPDGVSSMPHTLRIPFTVDEASSDGMPDWFEQFIGPPPLATDAEQDIARALVAFAKKEARSTAVPLADEVTLGLNTVDYRQLTRSQLASRESWNATVEHFDGLEGDFSVLDVLARSEFVRITTGPIPHCAGPPLEWPEEFEGLRQINIEPIGTDSCMQWFGVSLFVNESDEIEAAILDLFGP